MKTTIAGAAVIGALLAAGAARAQDLGSYRPKRSTYIVNYEASTALGSFSDDFVSDTSWRGFSFEARSGVHPRLSVGVGFTFNRFYQTYSLLTLPTASGGTLSGPVYRYADQFAVKGLVHAYLLEGPIQPYVGVGLGGVWTYSLSQTADLAVSDDGFDFIASPEVGVTVTLARGATSLGLNLAVRYNYTTADFSRVSDAQSVAVALGLFWAH